jgi:RNA polymerase sigma-70 factor (ECF subfamily)
MTEPTFEDLFRAHRASVSRVVQRLGVSAAEADEVSQEAFLVAFQKLDGYQERGAGRAWLARIATNLTCGARGGRRSKASVGRRPPTRSG